MQAAHRPHHPRVLQALQCALAVTLLAATSVNAQTVDDGIMLSRLKYCTGVFYSYDYWNHYWEGSLNRVNGNIGTITTRNIQYIGNYGVTDRLDVLFSVPYVYTSASKGVLHGQSGYQDFTLAAKAKLLSVPVRHFGAARVFGVVNGALPMSGYTPDDMPMSIGTNSKRISGRGTLNYLGKNGLYINGSAAYTWRSNVVLARPSYYTNGHLYFSNEVAMPNQFDYTASAGYRKNDTTLTGSFTQQQTRGGGDIRPQDAPFVSNRVNFSKVGATLTVPLPRVHDLQYWFIYGHIFDGRNVGQANTFTSGLLYTFDFNRNKRVSQ